MIFQFYRKSLNRINFCFLLLSSKPKYSLYFRRISYFMLDPVNTLEMSDIRIMNSIDSRLPCKRCFVYFSCLIFPLDMII